MTDTPHSFKDISPEVHTWAVNKLNEDREFIENRARFGSPLIKTIAGMILEIGKEESPDLGSGQRSEHQGGTHDILLTTH